MCTYYVGGLLVIIVFGRFVCENVLIYSICFKKKRSFFSKNIIFLKGNI